MVSGVLISFHESLSICFECFEEMDFDRENEAQAESPVHLLKQTQVLIIVCELSANLNASIFNYGQLLHFLQQLIFTIIRAQSEIIVHN